MNPIILSCCHGLEAEERRKIYSFFLTRMSRIKHKFGIETLVVGSDGELSKEMTEGAGLWYAEYDNKPVSNKWNYGLGLLRFASPDYVIEIGGDDLVSDSLIERYMEIFEENGYGVVGITDSYYISLRPSNPWFDVCYYWPGYAEEKIIGYARAYSARLLDAVGWRLWPSGIDSGLNAAAEETITKSGFPFKSKAISIFDEDLLHIDIKTIGNISSMNPIIKRAKEVSLDGLLCRHLPKEESDIITEHVDYLSIKKWKTYL